MQIDIRIGTMVNRGMGSPEYIEQILPHGFESFQLSFWQHVREVDFGKLSDACARVLEGSGAVISALAVFGNPMETEEGDRETLRAWEAAIDNASRFGCDIVAGFTGRLRDRPIPKCLERFKEIWGPLAERALKNGIRIAFENCDMGGTWQRGDWNIAHDPQAWQMMFDALPAENLGLEWEPCHQMVSLIDPMPQIREWGHRFFHLHGKDATVYWDRIRRYGIHASVHEDIAIQRGVQPIPPFVYHRTPGFGDSNWTNVISELRAVGFKGSIDIEGWHDPVMRDELEMSGQVAGLRYLKSCRGDLIDNPG